MASLKTGPVEPARKTPPKANVGGLTYVYTASPDGADSNLLILFHGLGDNEHAFGQLGKQLQRSTGGKGGPLPQAATLAIRGPEPLPFFADEPRFLWFKSFSPLGEEIPNPDPRPTLNALTTLIEHLTDNCGWRREHMHLLGFAQGGTAALELAIHLGRTGPALGSVVTVDGPLLQHPTFTPPVPTQVLAYHRGPLPKGLNRAFTEVTDIKAPRLDDDDMPAMPRARAGEWDAIVRWWAGPARWRNRMAMELSGDAVAVQ